MILPVALICPLVNILPPIILAVALTIPAVFTLPPVTLPDTLTFEPVIIPPTVLAAFTAPVTLRLVPVASPMFGVVKVAPALTIMLPPPSNAVVVLSTLAAITVPLMLIPLPPV